MKELDILSFKLELADLLEKFDIYLNVDENILYIDKHVLGNSAEVITPRILRK
jgi:hypothetical protein